MKHLPEAQLEIMRSIWDAEVPVTRNEIQRKLPEDRWQTTTLNTFLSRLSKGGFLKIERKGKEYVYRPLVTKEEYMEFAGKSILKNLYDNSIKMFVASVCNSNEMTEKEVKDLQELLSKLKEDDRD